MWREQALVHAAIEGLLAGLRPADGRRQLPSARERLRRLADLRRSAARLWDSVCALLRRR
jgi:hypothetical protein